MAIKRTSRSKGTNRKSVGNRFDAKPAKTCQSEDSSVETDNGIEILWESPRIGSPQEKNHSMITRGKLKNGLIATPIWQPFQYEPTRRRRTRARAPTSTTKRNFKSKPELFAKKSRNSGFRPKKVEMENLWEDEYDIESMSTRLVFDETFNRREETRDMNLGFDSLASSLIQNKSLETKDKMQTRGGCGLCVAVKCGLKYGFVLVSGLAISYYAYMYRDFGYEIIENYMQG